ncbi:hypothetical protein ACOMHN_038930 [Nucella lapillus]
MTPYSGIYKFSLGTIPDINAVEKVQCQATHWVSHRFYQIPGVNEMLQALNWPPLAGRRRRERLTAFYKLHHGLPTINSKCPSFSCKTRPMTYDTPHIRTTYRNFFPRIIPE